MSDEAKKSATTLSVRDLGLKTDLEKKIKAEKKINCKDELPADVAEKICKHFDLFNSLPSEATTLDGYDLKEIEILNELVEFIFPDAVRFDISTYLTKDLLIRTERPADFKFNKLEWEETMAQFRNFFKKDSTSNRTSLSDLRKQYNLTDIVTKVACPFEVDVKKAKAKDFKVRYVNEAFMPIFINVDLAPWFTQHYFNAFASDTISDMMAKKKFNE